MNPFQIVVVAFAACLFTGSIIAMARGWLTRREGLVWAVVWLAAGVTVAWPDVTAIVANALGIGRGADLLLYCSVIVMMVGFLMIYARLRAVRRDLTLLVRRLAIDDAVTTRSATPETSSQTTGQERSAE